MSSSEPRMVSFRAEGFDTFLDVLHKTYGSAGDAMIFDMSVKYCREVILRNLPDLPE